MTFDLISRASSPNSAIASDAVVDMPKSGDSSGSADSAQPWRLSDHQVRLAEELLDFDPDCRDADKELLEALSGLEPALFDESGVRAQLSRGSSRNTEDAMPLPEGHQALFLRGMRAMPEFLLSLDDIKTARRLKERFKDGGMVSLPQADLLDLGILAGHMLSVHRNLTQRFDQATRREWLHRSQALSQWRDRANDADDAGKRDAVRLILDNAFVTPDIGQDRWQVPHARSTGKDRFDKFVNEFFKEGGWLDPKVPFNRPLNVDQRTPASPEQPLPNAANR